MLEGCNIKFRFSNKYVLNGVNLSLKNNTVVGLIGANGAGKSTTLKVLSGQLPLFDGEIFLDKTLLNYADPNIFKSLGYVSEYPVLYEDMSVIEFFEFFAGLFGLAQTTSEQKIAELVSLFQLQDVARVPIKRLSKGFKQRVHLARALIHNPKILFLDEPTSGLDPLQLLEFYKIIDIIRKDRLILMTSHRLEEVRGLCDEVLLLNEGRISKIERLEDFDVESEFSIGAKIENKLVHGVEV